MKHNKINACYEVILTHLKRDKLVKIENFKNGEIS